MEIQTVVENRPALTLDQLKGLIEAQGGVDVKELGEYAEYCWSGC